MKIIFNKFAISPVYCDKCHNYVWLERYRKETYWREFGNISAELSHNTCKECYNKEVKTNG